MADVQQDYRLTAPPQIPTEPAPRGDTPIVPQSTIGGRALIAVIAIMAFLASLTTGAVILVGSAASEWQADVAAEVTIQIRPADGRDIEADLARAVAIARAVPGIVDVRPFSREESARLLEPWLGSGLIVQDLPLPRMIVVRIARGAQPDFASLRATLAREVPTGSLDDHRGWIERMEAMSGTAVVGGMIVLVLVFVATVLSVTFATRSAMATNRNVVEVLHLVGAKHRFIAGHFQRHFLLLGLKGAAIGGGVAIVLILASQAVGDWFIGTAGVDQLSALFGTFSIGLTGYAVIVAQLLLIAIVTAATSRYTVNRMLDAVA